MEDNVYQIGETTLIELLEAYHHLASLEAGNVQDWTNYQSSMDAYLADYRSEHGIADVTFGFTELALIEVQNFTKI